MYKILFHLNCLEQGGAERVVSNLANHFSKKGHEVVVTTQWQGEVEFRLDERVKRIHVGLRPEDEGKSRIHKIWLRISYLRKCLKREKPDIVIAFAHKANYRALLSGIGIKAPVMISVRTDPSGTYDSFMDRLGIRFLFRRAAGCVFQTEGQREFFPEYVQKKSRIIFNPISDKYLDVPETELRERTVVQSGRLAQPKNQPMLLRAFLKVHEKHPDHVLKLYGGDSLDGTREILEGIIKENHAQDFIKLMGASDRLEQELPKASVFAFSSDWEGLPNALMEAMALGLPVVATDCPCGGPRTLIKDGENGLLIPVGDEEAMAAGIERLIEDRELAQRLGRNARKIREKANEATVIAQWQDYMEEVISRSTE